MRAGGARHWSHDGTLCGDRIHFLVDRPWQIGFRIYGFLPPLSNSEPGKAVPNNRVAARVSILNRKKEIARLANQIDVPNGRKTLRNAADNRGSAVPFVGPVASVLISIAEEKSSGVGGDLILQRHGYLAGLSRNRPSG